MRQDRKRNGWGSRSLGLSALLLTTGVLHFAFPRPYDGIVPPQLPGSSRGWTYASGVAELVVGAGLLSPRTRRPAATAAAVLFVAVFPANAYMAYEWRDRAVWQQVVAIARLPLQVPLVLWALRIRAHTARE